MSDSPLNRKTILFISIALVTVVLDQLSKMWVYRNIDLHSGEIRVVPGLVSLVHSENPGAVFGLGDNFEYRIWLFLGFTVVAVGIVVNLWWKLPARDRFLSSTLGLILAGAVGNGIDRVTKQTVTDFLLVYTDHSTLKPWMIDTFGTNRWPSFNVADMALTVGVGLFIVHQLFLEKKEEPTEAAEDPEPG